MNTYAKITALYERLSIGDEQRGGEDSSSIKSQKAQLGSAVSRSLRYTHILVDIKRIIGIAL